MLQPGDRLVYQPLEFEIHINLAEKSNTETKVPGWSRGLIFSRSMPIARVQLPPGTPKSLKTKIQEKAAFLGEKKIRRRPICIINSPANGFRRPAGPAGRASSCARAPNTREPPWPARRAGTSYSIGFSLMAPISRNSTPSSAPAPRSSSNHESPTVARAARPSAGRSATVTVFSG